MSRWIAEFDPEDETFWERDGKRIARRNLVWSIVAENIGFSVWLLWSVVAPRLPSAGFAYTTDQLFLLIALPGLVGAVMRFPYTFAVPKLGGRNWTIASALLLLVPTLSLAWLVARPATPFWMMALAASSAGLGGGNFASSMANISFFYPDREKGFALGLNAAGGNVGVSTVQLLVPIAVTLGAAAHVGGVRLSSAGLMWLPLIAVAALGATFFMDNLATVRSTFREQLAVASKKHTWIMSWLYVGTFGSFVGYSAAFPLLLRTQFPDAPSSLAFTGALVGAVARPIGGKIADRMGGARVTFWNFVSMGAASLGALACLGARSFPGFLAMFLVLFVTTGIGNGATFRMIPVIFRAESLRVARGDGAKEADGRERAARRDGAAVIGIASAIGALGGYFIPQAFSASIRATGGVRAAFVGFLLFYVTCIAITWWHYVRTTFLVDRAPSLAAAKV
jgi:NNP family nitrate/nitrite transporter-like MFS transporter